MSRAKDGKRRARQFQRLNGHNAVAAAKQPPPQLHELPPNIAIKHILRGIERLCDHLTDLELKIEFVLRYFKMQRPKHGGLVDANGHAEMETCSLRDIFYANRDQMAEVLLKEKQDAAQAVRAQQAAAAVAADAGANAAASATPDPGSAPGTDADTVTGPVEYPRASPRLVKH